MLIAMWDVALRSKVRQRSVLGSLQRQNRHGPGLGAHRCGCAEGRPHVRDRSLGNLQPEAGPCHHHAQDSDAVEVAGEILGF